MFLVEKYCRSNGCFLHLRRFCLNVLLWFLTKRMNRTNQEFSDITSFRNAQVKRAPTRSRAETREHNSASERRELREPAKLLFLSRHTTYSERNVERHPRGTDCLVLDDVRIVCIILFAGSQQILDAPWSKLLMTSFRIDWNLRAYFMKFARVCQI